MNVVEVDSQLSKIAKRLRREDKQARLDKKPPDPKSRIAFGRGYRRHGKIEYNGDGPKVRMSHQHYGEWEPNRKYAPTLRLRLPKRKTPHQMKVELTEHRQHKAIVMRAVVDRLQRLRANRRRKVK